MNKNSLSALMLCVILLLSTVSFAQQGPYFSGKIGVGWVDNSDTSESLGVYSAKVDNSFSSGTAISVASGYNFVPFRLEGELAYQVNDFDSIEVKVSDGVDTLTARVNTEGDISNYAVMVNGYYDMRNYSPISLFVGGGIGAAYIEVNDFNIKGSGVDDENDDDIVFAYQFIAGLGYEVSDNVTVDLTYRYFSTSDPDYEYDLDYTSQNGYLGVRIGF